MAGPSLRTPICAAPITSGFVPYAFESRTRSVSPPILMRAFIRSVWLANAPVSAGAGVAVQVPTQCMPLVMAPSALGRPGHEAVAVGHEDGRQRLRIERGRHRHDAVH